MTRRVTRRAVLGVMGVTLAGRPAAGSTPAGETDPSTGRTAGDRSRPGRAAEGHPGAEGPRPSLGDAWFTRWLPAPSRLPEPGRYPVDAVRAPDRWSDRGGTLPLPAGVAVERELTLATHRTAVTVVEGPDRDRLLGELDDRRPGYRRVDPAADDAPTFLRTGGRSLRLAAVTDGALVVGRGRGRPLVADAVEAVLAARAGRVPRYVESDGAMRRVATRVRVGDVAVLEPDPPGYGGRAAAESLTLGEQSTVRTALTVGAGAVPGGPAAPAVERAGRMPIPADEAVVDHVDGGRTALATARLDRGITLAGGRAGSD